MQKFDGFPGRELNVWWGGGVCVEAQRGSAARRAKRHEPERGSGGDRFRMGSRCFVCCIIVICLKKFGLRVGASINCFGADNTLRSLIYYPRCPGKSVCTDTLGFGRILHKAELLACTKEPMNPLGNLPVSPKANVVGVSTEANVLAG